MGLVHENLPSFAKVGEIGFQLIDKSRLLGQEHSVKPCYKIQFHLEIQNLILLKEVNGYLDEVARSSEKKHGVGSVRFRHKVAK